MDHARPHETEQRRQVETPIRRVRSPSIAPGGFTSYKPRFGGRVSTFRDEHSFRKPGSGFGLHGYYHGKSRHPLDWRNHSGPKFQHAVWRGKESASRREKEKEREMGQNKKRENSSTVLPQKDTGTTEPLFYRSVSSREKDKHLNVSNEQIKSKEKEREGAPSTETKQMKEKDVPLDLRHATARHAAIHKKRKEIEKVYRQDCETFGTVVKMLITKDPSLEQLIQSSLQENLREIGVRCVEAMELFIEEYDTRCLSH